MAKNYIDGRDPSGFRDKVFFYNAYSRAVCAEDDAFKIRSMYPGLSANVIRRLTSYYRYSSDNNPSECLAVLTKILPSYYGSYENSINFINRNIGLLFMKASLIKPKLACLHMINVDGDALENCISLITRCKIRNLFSVCCALKLAENSDKVNNLESKEVYTLMLKIAEEGKLGEYNKLFSQDNVSFTGVQLDYERFLNSNKDTMKLNFRKEETK
ncbi:MAG: hypothetical protein RSD96_03025 [Bacilli bacterium]